MQRLRLRQTADLSARSTLRGWATQPGEQTSGDAGGSTDSPRSNDVTLAFATLGHEHLE
jgi:hypothetical protein